MTNRTTRALAAICGIAGVAMLTAHFLIPASVPPDSASLGRIAAFAREHRDAILVSAWLQVTGAILYVVFISRSSTSPVPESASPAGSSRSPPRSSSG